VSRTSKSPKSVVFAALSTARRGLSAYSHKYSPKVFNQYQLFACLVLKNFLKTDYRGVSAYLEDHPSLCEVMELERIPHFTTLQKASKRLLAAKPARRLLDETVRLQMGRKKRVSKAAIDSTGLQCGTASSYFVRRRKKTDSPWKTVTYHRYPKLAIVCDTSNHFILASRVGSGPRPDVDEFRPLVADALKRVRMTTMVADAGYDSEPNHQFARKQYNIRTMIPPKHGRPTQKPAKGKYRRLMQTRFDRDIYRNRVQVETVMSMIKRRQGSYVKARTYWSQCRDLRLMTLAHNIMILMFAELFYRAGQASFRWRKEA
jgi:hypothetical protein